MRAGFSERTFEFCYNMEYCQVNAAILASHPHIPSQNEEKDLGYDVEFLIRTGVFTRSLFLQHKVAHFAEVRAGRNARFFNWHNGPYFRFSIDNEQHNVLHKLSSERGNAFYCAPRFHLRTELENHFRGPSIIGNSVLLDPINVGNVTDNDGHNITYGPAGQRPTLHSEPRLFDEDMDGLKRNPDTLKRQIVDNNYVNSLSAELIELTRESKFRKAITAEIEDLSPIQKAQNLLARVYNVTWILLP